MSEPINANPTVLDLSALPTRLPKSSSKLENLPSLYDPLYSLSLFSSDLKFESPPSSPPSLIADDETFEPIDAQEIYDLVSTISDPEHPLTLGQLAVVNLPHIEVLDSGSPNEMAEVKLQITPTITHCSLATLIGLGIRVRLERCLPPRYRITLSVRPGTHQSEGQVNKQLNDKERVAAACENEQLLGVISNMLSTCR
jgi:hypothetical protein